MKRTTFDDSRDQRIAAEAGTQAMLMCSAHGCPNRWSTTQDGNLCRWHASADRNRWPEITQQQQRDEAERAQMRNDPRPYVEPLTPAEKRAILSRLGQVFKNRGPKDWAWALRDREASGERLTAVQRESWRTGLRAVAREGDEA